MRRCRVPAGRGRGVAVGEGVGDRPRGSSAASARRSFSASASSCSSRSSICLRIVSINSKNPLASLSASDPTHAARLHRQGGVEPEESYGTDRPPVGMETTQSARSWVKGTARRTRDRIRVLADPASASATIRSSARGPGRVGSCAGQDRRTVGPELLRRMSRARRWSRSRMWPCQRRPRLSHLGRGSELASLTFPRLRLVLPGEPSRSDHLVVAEGITHSVTAAGPMRSCRPRH